jgi:hypothetical protein
MAHTWLTTTDARLPDAICEGLENKTQNILRLLPGFLVHLDGLLIGLFLVHCILEFLGAC